MPIIDVEQNSDEWLRMRAGCCTGSRVSEAITKLKSGKYSADRDHYILETAFGRMTGLHYDHFVTAEMKYGLEMESIARATYEMALGVSVDPGGIAVHDRIKGFCASPDGLVDPDGAIEIKVPKPSTHLEWIKNGSVPKEHLDQMKAVMACANRQWCDFISYCPIMPERLQLFVRRLERDQPMIDLMELEVELFLDEVEKTIESLRSKEPALVLIGMEAK